MYTKAKELDGGGWVENGNYFLHKESLGCINISQGLEPKLILGPYTELREVLSKNKTLLGSHNGIAVRGVF